MPIMLIGGLSNIYKRNGVTTVVNLTKKDTAKMLYEINCYTNRDLAHCFLWESDIDNPDFSHTQIEKAWNNFLRFMEQRYTGVFNQLVAENYITSSVRFDTSVFAYFKALNGTANWNVPGHKPNTCLPPFDNNEREQYEIISCYIVSHAAIARELDLFYTELRDADFDKFCSDLNSRNAFDTFWNTPVRFDVNTNKGLSLQ